MAKLYDKDTGRYIGSVTGEDLQFLIDALEEEGVADADYWIDRATLDILKEKGMKEHLAELIGAAMGSKGGIEIRYTKEE